VTAPEVNISWKLLLQARFAAEGTALRDLLDEVIAKEAQRIEKTADSAAITRLRKIAIDGSVGETLPFQLDSLDLDIATLLVPQVSGTGHKGVIFGMGARVNAGFAVVRDNHIEYVDSWVEPSRTDPRAASSLIATRLIPANRSWFRAEAQSLQNIRPVAVVAEEEEPAILLRGANLASSAKGIQPSYLSCSVLDPHAKSALGTVLAGMRLSFDSIQNVLRIAPTTPETLIQLSAAYQQKRWMEISSGEFRATFAIPDISESGHSSPAWILRVVDDDRYIFSRQDIQIPVAMGTALKCCEAFRWFFIPDNLEMVRTLSTVNFEKSGLLI
jgi:hypothetical protein